tara:strand:+ start:156 stop:944 length:789 start_codon:yes stop_codon:yes gene_type:complete
MKVALVQMTSVPDIHKNISFISESIIKAKNNKADIVLFPENCGFMGTGKLMQKNASYEKNHLVLKASKELAKKYRIFVLLGSIAVLKIRNNNLKMANRSYLIDDRGEVLVKYDKINMFDVVISKNEVYRESDRYHAGENIVNVESKLGNFGLSICYDIRFPDLYSKLVKRGVNIITIPSAFTVDTGKAHWEILLRSRAIETSCWVLAPAQVGNHYDNRNTWGHSMIIDPWGRIVEEANKNIGIIYANIDVNFSNKTKKKWGL